ncbi:MAG: ATP-binding cassette domain-containing protein [Mycoplasmoidaceae bacterium]|nr:ATP-binding cassette domain-containing protein [Mycoplasmoidaceae bacterium]
MEKLIQIKKVSKHFGNGKNKIQALKNVSFDVFKGQNISLVGANGAGKTTLVEILAQLNKPSSGKIIYNLGTEKPINELIGIQFQDSMYPNGLSAVC